MRSIHSSTHLTLPPHAPPATSNHLSEHSTRLNQAFIHSRSPHFTPCNNPSTPGSFHTLHASSDTPRNLPSTHSDSVRSTHPSSTPFASSTHSIKASTFPIRLYIDPLHTNTHTWNIKVSINSTLPSTSSSSTTAALLPQFYTTTLPPHVLFVCEVAVVDGSRSGSW